MTRIVSNFRGLDEVVASSYGLAHEYISDSMSVFEFLRKSLRADIVILNINQRRLMLACLIRWLVPFARFKLVSVDLILRTPKSRPDQLKAWVKRLLLSGVDRFILYFKNGKGYRRYYGIAPNRVHYVPFKVNSWASVISRKNDSAGEHVLCAGRTLRDIATFVEAMRRVTCPGVLLQQKRDLLAAHGTAVWSGELPSNLQLIVDDGDRIDDFLNYISRARLVVIPRFKNDIAPTGISTYLVAMALNKCVIISEGPGADDVLSDEAVIVPSQDAEALAEQIERLWRDDDLRRSIAARGHKYAMACGDEMRLMIDVLRSSLETTGAEFESSAIHDTAGALASNGE